MWGIIRKDIRRNQAVILAWLILLLSFSLTLPFIKTLYARSLVFGAFSIVATAVAPLFIQIYAAIEEKHRSLGWLKSLPLAPSLVVLPPFIIAFLLVIVFAAIVILFEGSISYIDPRLAELRPDVGPFFILSSLPVAGLGIAAFFKSGFNKSRRLTTIVLLAWLPLGSAIMQSKRIPKLELNLLPLVALISLALFCIEFILARWFFDRREIF